MADWIKEWAIVISAGATFILAIVAFLAIWQNYRFRKDDRERLRKERVAKQLSEWMKETQNLYYLSYDENKDEVYKGFTKVVSEITAMTTAAIILGDEFLPLIKRVNNAITSYYSGIKEKRTKGKQIEEHVMKEFEACVYGLELYLEALRIWDYDYAAFLKDARAHGLLPFEQHLSIDETT